MFQVPQQEEEPKDSDRSMKNLIRSKNNFNQSVNRLEVQVSRLINIMKERNKETLTHVRLFSIALTILIRTTNHGVLETLTKSQFHQTNLKLTNSKP